MQNDQSSLRTQRIIKHLEDLWQIPQEPSPDVLKQITQFILSLQEPYKTIGLEKIAEHTISNMNLHILALMATFQQKAEQEGISSEALAETFAHIDPEIFRILDTLYKHTNIQSLDDLVALSNITVGLQTLSQTTSAEEAQSWLYELPKMYYQQLTQESLIVSAQNPEESNNIIASSSSHFTDWISYNTGQRYLISETGTTQMTITTEKTATPIEVPVSLEISKLAVRAA